VLGIPVFVASPEDTIVAKLESSLELAEEWAVAKTTEL